MLLHAFARLGPQYHLVLIGGDREARPNANVSMLPYRRDSLELAQNGSAFADVLVHAGTKETFGLVILEAMACGRPVVAARAGAIPGFVDSSVGVLAEPNSGASMAEAIAALFERDVEALGAAARARAQAVHLGEGVSDADGGVFVAGWRQRPATPTPSPKNFDGRRRKRAAANNRRGPRSAHDEDHAYEQQSCAGNASERQRLLRKPSKP